MSVGEFGDGGAGGESVARSSSDPISTDRVSGVDNVASFAASKAERRIALFQREMMMMCRDKNAPLKKMWFDVHLA